MNFVSWVEHHRRSLILIAAALALAGVFSISKMPYGVYPVISFPRIRIEVDSGTRPAQQQLYDVTAPIERMVRRVPHALDVESTTSRGSTELFVDFPWGTNMHFAYLGVQAALSQILPELPPGTTYNVIQMLPNVIMPFSSYSLTSKTVSQVDLLRMAKFQIAPMLMGIPGVARVGTLGGRQREIEAVLNPAKLRAFGLTLADVENAVKQSNVLEGVGHLQDNDLLYLMFAKNGLTGAKSIRDITLRTAQHGIIRLADIATISKGVVPRWYLVRDQGLPSVEINVYQQSSADMVALQNKVKKKLKQFMAAQPKSIHLVKWYDQTQLVRSSVAAVEEGIVIGLFLAGLVVLFFLRNWRATSVAMVVVPMAVLITSLLLYVLGMSFNMMTLGGLAASIGLLIDDVIVMIEQIARRAGTPGLTNPQSAVLLATKEFLRPLTGSSLATIVIFIPLAFLSGVTGAFFRYLSLTMALALIISYLLTAFVVPILARTVIDFQKWHDPSHDKPDWFKRTHGRALDAVLRRPIYVGIGVVILLGVGYIGMQHTGSGFLPKMDEGGFVFNYQTNPGTSLNESNRELHQVEDIIRSNPYVAAYSRRTGAGLGGDLNEPNQGDIYVRLINPDKRPNIWKVMDQIDNKVTRDVPGIDFGSDQLLTDNIGDMVGRPEPVVVDVSAKNPAILDNVAQNVADAISKVRGVDPSSVNNGVVPAGDALEIHVDKAAATMEGMTTQEVQTQVNAYLHGIVATKFIGTLGDVGVRLWIDPPQEAAMRRRQLQNLPIRAPNGYVFPLNMVAKVDFVAGQPEITRKNLAQIVEVTAEISGRDLGSTAAAIQKVLAKPGLLPPGVTYTMGGLYKQQQIAFRGMVAVFIAALIAEIVLLLFLYERILLPIIIICTSVISTSAVFVGLWLTGIELNITALMGMVMILGIGTEMAIFYVSEYQELSRIMPPRQALYDAALNRLRPILMSVLAMILALLPLGAAISGAGDQMQQPLAVAIIAGIIVQLPMVLLAMPVVINFTIRKHGDTVTPNAV
ncbi:efflux RND transporter permease subunit [Acidiphilium sp. AL]|uniref:Efflux RND transporter permease subunit n=1 Tax=Acidiphilium iwatense TaxID=768198 RepID=A0ABS9DXX1_9PROT|nr:MULTISPECIES: efflux RND transporter permease subunit [Acidiphilium]MCF3947030.1 efflux RND transporter permease subunit [Acidiphilium iwatense]MCU4160294.1 efflux RND transporter permease subunit [Acidiphilium sp. AL]